MVASQRRLRVNGQAPLCLSSALACQELGAGVTLLKHCFQLFPLLGTLHSDRHSFTYFALSSKSIRTHKMHAQYSWRAQEAAYVVNLLLKCSRQVCPGLNTSFLWEQWRNGMAHLESV